MAADDVETFLHRPLTGHLATSGPHVRPVWYLWEEEAFWVISGPWSRVPMDIEDDPLVALDVSFTDLVTGEVKQVVTRAKAELLPWDPERAGRLLRRYLGDDFSSWDERFRWYMSGEPGCVWVRIPVSRLRLGDQSFVPSR